MANLNLSEFTEKLFVADADHTFIWDTAASISKRVSRNSWLNSGTLTSDAPVTISQTWNNAAVVFTGLKVNAAGTSDANSASGSLLADFQLNGASLFKVQKNGRATFSTSTGVVFKFNEVSGSISGDSSNSFGTVFINGDQSGGGASVVSLGGGGSEGVTCRSSGFFAFSSSGNNALHANRDTILLRDGAANTLALRNGAAAQTFRVYNTYTDASNYERAAFGYGSNQINLGSDVAGSGVHRKLNILGAGIDFYHAGIGLRWSISTSGHFIAAADNTYDIGAIGASRPRTGYFGTGVDCDDYLRTGRILFGTSTIARISSTGNGILLFAGTSPTDFYRVQFGGLDNTYPAIARDGAGIKFTGAAAGSTAWIKVPPVAVGSLPLANTAGAGARAFVNDASAPVFGSAVTGGGAVLVPVYSDGSAWNVG